MLQQATQKLEKQLNNSHAQNESMQKTFQQNEYSYQEKVKRKEKKRKRSLTSLVFLLFQINECESLLRSLKDANRETVSLLEQKKTELNLTNSEIQSLKYENSAIIAKVKTKNENREKFSSKFVFFLLQMEKVDEMNEELKRHVAAVERSNDDQKRLIRKREKELDQVKNDLEINISNSVALNHKVRFGFLIDRFIFFSFIVSVQNKKQNSMFFVLKILH